MKRRLSPGRTRGTSPTELSAPRGLAQFLAVEEGVLACLARVQQYASLRFAEDSTDAGAKTLLIKAQELLAQTGIDLVDRWFWQRGFDLMHTQWPEPLESLS